MKNRNLTTRAALTLSALVILIGASLAAAPAQAGVKFGVRVDTPVVKARYHSSGHGSRIHVRVPAYDYRVKITQFDRQVARKLARRTDYSKGELLRLKRAGYNWGEIGRILHLPRKMVRRVIRDVRIDLAGYDDRRYNDFGYWDDDYRDGRRNGGHKGDNWCGTR